MSDEAALLNVIYLHADEDTPRLAYADWLDEHADSDRAEFIRVQCRLADLSPAAPDWVDLRERQDELIARLKHRRLTSWKKNPRRFYFEFTSVDGFQEEFRRGFPYCIDCQTAEAEWTSREVERVITELTRLVRTSTIRGFNPYDIPLRALKELLAAPVATELTALSVSPYVRQRRPEDAAEFYRLVANSPALRGLRHLNLHSGDVEITTEAVEELVNATALDSVRRLTIQDLNASSVAVLDDLTEAAWFRRLRHFWGNFETNDVAVPMTSGLGALPDLHTLDLPRFAPGAVPALAAGKFPALGRLIYGGPLDATYPQILAGARFPALAVFEGCGGMYGGRGGLTDDGLAALLKADWFARLRVLELAQNAIGDKGLKALAAHPVARTLRALVLGDNAFGTAGLRALAKRGAFPELTALSLKSYSKRKGTSAELATFLSALRLPKLRHLDLTLWPLGNAGAKALAANPALAGLTRLTLSQCCIGDPGAKALFASPHLQNLVELRLDSNRITSGAAALADPAVMPHLGECWLLHNKIPPAAGETFQRAGMYLFV